MTLNELAENLQELQKAGFGEAEVYLKCPADGDEGGFDLYSAWAASGTQEITEESVRADIEPGDQYVVISTGVHVE